MSVLLAQLLAEDESPHQVEMRMMEGSASLPSPAMEMAYVACGMGLKPADFPKQVKNRIALVQRGDITFVDKAVNAEKAGAVACVIYNNRPGNFFGTLGDEVKPTVPVVSISMEDGELMLSYTREKSPISRAKLQLNPDEIPQSYRLADFSSRGPNNDGWIKPELTAPGVNVTSATIVKAASPGGGMPDPSGYISASGTSMATPHVAGAVALIRQAHPEWSSMHIKAALVNTARHMPEQGGIMDQGNGAMDLERAIDCRAVLVTADDPFEPAWSFGEVVHDGTEHSVSRALTIHSLLSEPDKGDYDLSVVMASVVDGLKAELSVGSITCDDHGCVASFVLTLTADGAVLRDGEYSGWVFATAGWGTLRLPFYYQAARTPGVQPVDPHAQSSAEPPAWKRVGMMSCC